MLDEILQQRDKVHGNFANTATLAQTLKTAIHNESITDLHKDQREALDLICTKIARICVGNPHEADHWFDIAGYAKLVYNRLVREKKGVVNPNERNTISSWSIYGHAGKSNYSLSTNDERSQTAQQLQPTDPR
jgi:hypothetical protein